MKKQRKILKKSWYVLVLLVVFGSALSAQTTISGVIVDGKTAEPLIGASVVVVGNESVGTSTDFDGKYSLELPADAENLMFSYLGYVAKTLEITGNVLDVALDEESEVLNEVVVIGYGTQKSKEVTSAVATVSSDDFNGGNINNPAQLLQGKVSGLTISKPGGDPNGGFDIRLRGISTFGDQGPLIVIDGVAGADLNSIDPTDVASMSVLKDASATSIYGARGTSGVILITTKKGRKGLISTEYSANMTVENVARAPQVLTADEFRSLSNTVDVDSSVSTNWMDEVARTGISHAHNLAIAGGTDKTNYRFAFNYRNGQGVILNSGFNRINGRMNINHKTLNDKLTINLDLSSTINKADLAINDALQFAARYNPTAPVTTDEAGSEDWGGYFQRDAFSFFNPVAILEQNKKRKETNTILGQIKGEYEILSGLKFGVTYSLNRNNAMYGEYWSKKSYWTPFATKSDKGYARRDWSEYETQIFDVSTTYENSIRGLQYKLLAGYSYQYSTKDVMGAQARDFLSDNFGWDNLGAGQQVLSNSEAFYSYKEESTLIGFLGRIALNYKDMAFMTANLRQDGSSRFGKNNKRGLFPGISGGVNIAKFVDIKHVPSLKLRVGYGESGNLVSSPYLSQSLYGPSSDQFFLNGEYVQLFSPTRNFNPDLKWEVKKELNAGIDFSLFDFKVNGNIDYFRSISSDLILEFKVPVPPNPVDKKWLNVGELENSGIELGLNTHPISKNGFDWSVDFTFTKFLETKLRKITSAETASDGILQFGDLGAPFLTGVNSVLVEEGTSLGALVGPVYTGIDSSGLLQYKDVNGDDIFDANDDIEVIGNGLPDFQLGLSNSFAYKNFDFNFFFRGVFGHDLLNVNNARYGVPVVLGLQSGMQSILDFKDATNGPVYSDVHVESASYLKLDNATFGYNFKMPEGHMFSKIRLYVAGQNLVTFTKYSGVDPSVRYTDNGNPLAPGIDRPTTYFATRSFTFGLNAGF